MPPDETPVRILLVDSDPIILDSLGGFLRSEGYEVVTASDTRQAEDHLRAGRFNLVITDVALPRSDGFALLRHVRKHYPEVVTILIAGYGTIESAVEAIKLGAYDYLTKPVIDDDVRLAVQRALEQQRLLAENQRLRAELGDRFRFENIVGRDPRMARVFELIDAVAPTRTNVLITGESGTGKSLIARAIHGRSERAAGPFVEVSCGALPDSLLESELFGHVRGAFTHAVSDKEGKFAAADGGTIFLDEIGAASGQLQVKLLRVLQERRFEPVGSNETRRVDVRVLFATNRDLQDQVRRGEFREDLYYRINVVNIPLPPLRDRPRDIPLLAEHFLALAAREHGRKVGGFSPEAMQALQRYDWPGNVRELENAMERAVVLAGGEQVRPGDLPPNVLEGSTPPAEAEEASPLPDGLSLAEALAAPEKRIIVAALRANDGARRATAEQLRIDRTTLYKKMKKYGLLERF